MDPVALGMLISTACNALVTAAVTDSWDKVRHKVAAWFGHGKPDEAILAKLDKTRADLMAATPGDAQRVRYDIAQQWQGRFRDLVEDYPDAAGELEQLVADIRTVISVGHSMGAGRDIHLEADRGGMAGVFHHVTKIDTYVAGAKDAPRRLPVSLPVRPVVLAGREELLMDLHAALTSGAPPRWRCCAGCAGSERRAWRLSTLTGTWLICRWPGS